MSKSELKTVIMRNEPFSGALTLTDNPYALAPPQHGAGVRVIVEDASVRFAGGPGKQEMTGNQFVQTFCRGIREAFEELQGLHTYVLLFDKKRYVPAEKGQTQTDRRETLAESAHRTNVPEWTWDGQSNVISRTTPLPPWPRVRLNGAAYAKALDNVVSMVMEQFVPPPRCRVIFDWASVPMVLESDEFGRAMAPYADVSLTNTIGEADMAAQWYSRLGRFGGMAIPERPETHEIRKIDAGMQAMYYPTTSQEQVGTCRSEYETGDVVLRSIDTDYLPLSMLHYTLHPGAHNVWLAIGKCSVKQQAGKDVFCTKTTKEAVEKGEIYDIRRLCQIVQTLHPPDMPAKDAVAAFVSFCTACGNDYGKRPFGITHRVMFAAYKKSPLQAVWTAAEPPVIAVTPESLQAFLQQCYWERLGTGNQPAGEKRTWDQVAAVVATTYADKRAHMPTPAEAAQFRNSLQWAVQYACLGPYGWTHVQNAGKPL